MPVTSPSLTAYFPGGQKGSLGRVVRGFTWTLLRSPEYSNVVQECDGGGEIAITRSLNPKWTYTFLYDYIKDRAGDLAPGATVTDYQNLLGWFLWARGNVNQFVWDDMSDNFSGPAVLPGGSTRNPQAQLQVVTDGTNYYSPLQRIVGPAGAAYGSFREDITDIVDASLNVYDETGPVTAFTVNGWGLSVPGASFQGLYLTWTGGAPDSNVYAEYHFLKRVKFATPKQDYEQFMQTLYTVGGSEGKNGSGQLILKTAFPPGV